jgi:hypothetical protein
MAGAALGAALANTLGAMLYVWIDGSGRFDVRLRLGGR